MEYNGFTNWSTWNVNLWVMNEEPLYREMTRLTKFRDFTATTVESFIRDLFPEGTPDMDQAGELDDVDWGQLAECFNE